MSTASIFWDHSNHPQVQTKASDLGHSLRLMSGRKSPSSTHTQELISSSCSFAFKVSV